jgi:hypothetical protein
MKKLGFILYSISLLAVGLGLITAIGTFLYSWGNLGEPIGASAWEGFIIWLKMLGGGLVGAFIGLFLIEVSKS